jgi:hypothetical protein
MAGPEQHWRSCPDARASEHIPSDRHGAVSPKGRPSPPQPPTTHAGKAPRPADHHNSLHQEPSRKKPQGQCTSGHRQQTTRTSKRSRAQQPPHRPPPKPGSPGTHPTLRHQSNGRRGQVCTVFGVLLSIEVGDPTPGRGKRHPNEPHRCESWCRSLFDSFWFDVTSCLPLGHHGTLLVVSSASTSIVPSVCAHARW